MQLESKHYYTIVSQEKGIPVELVKSVGDAVFQSLYELQHNPPNLILNIKGLGRRFVRLAKTKDRLLLIGSLISQPDSEQKVLRDRKELSAELDILTSIMSKYDNYIAEKLYTKNLKDEYPQDDPAALPAQEFRKTRPDNPGKYQGIPPRKYKSTHNKNGLSETFPGDRAAGVVAAPNDQGKIPSMSGVRSV